MRWIQLIDDQLFESVSGAKITYTQLEGYDAAYIQHETATTFVQIAAGPVDVVRQLFNNTRAALGAVDARRPS